MLVPTRHFLYDDLNSSNVMVSVISGFILLHPLSMACPYLSLVRVETSTVPFNRPSAMDIVPLNPIMSVIS